MSTGEDQEPLDQEPSEQQSPAPDTAAPGLFIRPAAKADLREHFLYVAQSNVERARQFVDAVEATCEQLVALPHLGSPREYSDPRLHHVRQWPVRGFTNILFFYRPFSSSNGIEVLRVLHSSRDAEAHLGTGFEAD